jgi:hypothetical protein
VPLRALVEERLEGLEVVPFDDQIAIETGLFPFGKQRELGIELQTAVRHRVVIRLDDGLAFELQHRHGTGFLSR